MQISMLGEIINFRVDFIKVLFPFFAIYFFFVHYKCHNKIHIYVMIDERNFGISLPICVQHGIFETSRKGIRKKLCECMNDSTKIKVQTLLDYKNTFHSFSAHTSTLRSFQKSKIH